MKSKLSWPLVIAVILAACICGWSVFGRKQTVTPTQWEYTVKLVPSAPEDKAAEAFNELGKEGWELVSVDDRRAYFKRPKM